MTTRLVVWEANITLIHRSTKEDSAPQLWVSGKGRLPPYKVITQTEKALYKLSNTNIITTGLLYSHRRWQSKCCGRPTCFQGVGLQMVRWSTCLLWSHLRWQSECSGGPTLFPGGWFTNGPSRHRTICRPTLLIRGPPQQSDCHRLPWGRQALWSPSWSSRGLPTFWVPCKRF